MNFAIKSEYHVSDKDDIEHENAPAITVTDNEENPKEYLDIITKDNVSIEYFGDLDLTLHVDYAEMLAQAILKKVKDIRDNV